MSRWATTILLAAALAFSQATPRLAWFNPRERLLAVDCDLPFEVSLYTTGGKWLGNLQPSLNQYPKVLQVPPEIPPGLYLVRLRSSAGEKLERILIF